MKKTAALFAMLFLLISTSAYPEEIATTIEHTCENKEPKHGWFWYCYEPPAEEEEKQIEDQKLPRLPKLSDYSYEDMWNMHPQEFRKLLDDLKNKAVMTLATKDVEDYLHVMNIARRKSLAFSNVATYVRQVNPALTSTADYPVAAPGRRAMMRQRISNVSVEIASARMNYGLVYFYSKDCPYCVEQTGILRFFQDKHGWDITGVDINLKPRAAERFNVERVPFILLVSKKTEGYIPLASGVVSLADLEKRLYRGIRLLSGETTPQDWTLYEYQRGGIFDVSAPLEAKK